MGRIYYNKLIRDKIPQQILDNDAEYEVFELDDVRFEEELFKKIGEEASGLCNATNQKEVIEELADILAVIEEIKTFKGISQEQIVDAMKKNFDAKGGFGKKLFLIWSSDTDYKTNERYYPDTKI